MEDADAGSRAPLPAGPTPPAASFFTVLTCCPLRSRLLVSPPVTRLFPQSVNHMDASSPAGRSYRLRTVTGAPRRNLSPPLWAHPRPPRAQLCRLLQDRRPAAPKQWGPADGNLTAPLRRERVRHQGKLHEEALFALKHEKVSLKFTLSSLSTRTSL